ncbi:hypothetical protein BDV11DRAFT_189688 [Aspergillus similis]
MVPGIGARKERWPVLAGSAMRADKINVTRSRVSRYKLSLLSILLPFFSSNTPLASVSSSIRCFSLRSFDHTLFRGVIA